MEIATTQHGLIRLLWLLSLGHYEFCLKLADLRRDASMLTWLQRDVSLTFSALERYSFEPIEGLNLVASWLEIYAGGFLPRADMLSPVNSTERNSQRFNTFAAKLDS